MAGKQKFKTECILAMDITQSCKNDLDNVSTPINRAASLSFSIGDVNDGLEGPSHYSVTAVLNYCKNKILKPYLRLLSVMGLRPLSVESEDNLTCLEFFGYIYTTQVILFMAIGYVLQYMACFRRDRGFGYKIINHPANDEVDAEVIYDQICHGSLIFSYIIPNTLHLCGYLYAVRIFRSSDDDQLPSLMERVFLSLSNLADGFVSQKKLVKTLWIFVASSLVWMALSFITVNFMMAEGSIDFKWIEKRPHHLIVALKILLMVSTLWHDMIQATVISNYCLQAQLLTSYLYFLRAKLLQYPIEPTDWMKDIQEFKKLLKFFNYHLAPAVCIFTMINICYAVSGLFWLLNYDHLDKETIPIIGISVLNVALWIFIALAPFLQASRLTRACEAIKSIGHEVRARPFVHQSTPGYKLDSILLYASSLQLNAKLFGIPITGRYIFFFLTFGCICILSLGQLHYLSPY